MQVHLFEPIVCRCPGLPFDRVHGSSAEELWSLLDDRAFCDCLATLNPGVFPGLRSRRGKLREGQRPSNTRRGEMTLYRYLVRFCSRNDTTGTAGTTMWGRFGERTELGGAGCHKRVWVSPRHLELLIHRGAFGPLRERARAALFPHFVRQGEGWWDSHRGEFVEGVPECWERPLGELSGPERRRVEELVERGVLTLRLGLPGEDPWEALVAAAAGSEWEGPLRELAELRGRLELVEGGEFAAGMALVDGLARSLPISWGRDPWAPPELREPRELREQWGAGGDGVNELFEVRTLDRSKVVRAMFRRALEMPGTLLQSRGVDETCSAVDLDLLERAMRPIEALELADYATEVLSLMDRALLFFAPPSGPRVPLRAMRGMGWERAAQLYGAAWPSEPVRYNPLAAENDLAEWLGARAVEAESPGYDRSFFLCDSSRDRFGLGSEVRERLEGELPAWFRLAGWQEFNRERMLAPVLTGVMGQEKELPLSVFLSRLAGQMEPDQRDFASPELEALCERIWGEDEQNWEVFRRGEAVEVRERPCVADFEVWLRDKRLVSTLDVMLDRSGGVLISEAHCGGDKLGLTTLYSEAHPGEASPGGGAMASMFGETLFVQPLKVTKQSPGILGQMADAILVVTNPEGFWPNRRCLPIGQLKVVQEAGELRVSDGERFYGLVTEHFSVGPVRCVSYSPLSLARQVCAKLPGWTGSEEVLPELRMGGLVLARRTVVLSGERVSQLGRGLREAFGLPRFVFVTTNKKPILCDFESPISWEILEAEVAGALQVRISPMQPGPEELWLEIEGRRYCSELRMVACADGAEFDLSPK